MRWLQIRFEAQQSDVALIETLLEQLGAASVILDDAADQPLLEPLPGETPIWDQVIVTGLFNDHEDDPIDADSLIGFVSAQAPTVRAFYDYLEEQVWERAWMDHYEPIQCGERLWIVPEWLTPPDPSAVNLMLDPGLAFGTGNHASTFLCLQWLDAEPLKGKTVIDYGCGSGILGIAALLLGAEKVYATDIDPQAILATRQNAEINGVADRLWVDLPEQFNQHYPDLCSDVIVANILAGPLAALAPEFGRRSQAGARIVLAGLISEQVEGLQHAYSTWFNLNELATREENWCRLSGTRNSA
ncbi:MAG: 50S ribosomal protein L11 methyltransferase [Pseudomonadota bacterium]|nr:50S ribosomal protein L11 methyltransferase [Pseudomonadota bacterium]